jgi:hypothetical protein
MISVKLGTVGAISFGQMKNKAGLYIPSSGNNKCRLYSNGRQVFYVSGKGTLSLANSEWKKYKFLPTGEKMEIVIS